MAAILSFTENEFNQIRSWENVKPFAGRTVAIKNLPLNFCGWSDKTGAFHKWVYHFPGHESTVFAKVSAISNEYETFEIEFNPNETKRSYEIFTLNMPGQPFSIIQTISDVTINQHIIMMRLATQDEIQKIDQVVQKGQAVFVSARK